MFGFEKIDLSISFNSIFLFLGLIILITYSIYVYRFTLPPVPNSKRIILTSLRAIALILLLFIFFEPILTITEKNILTPTNIFFIDNSKSIAVKDGTNRVKAVKSVIDGVLSNSLKGKKEYYSFGSVVKLLNEDSLDYSTFSETTTDFSKIFLNINQIEKNISSITIISDGVITEGSTPIYTAEKIGIPVFTVGIGDSTRKNDIEIKNVVNNDFIYAETATTILATILNKGFTGKVSHISLFEDSQLIEQKSFTLNNSGVNSISLNYTPERSGEKKLKVQIDNLDGESTYLNNQKVFYVKVLSNKINVLLIAGSPSADLTFIKKSLSADANLNVNTLTEIAVGNFLETNAVAKIDSADIIYLIEFPTVNTDNIFYNKLVDKLLNKSTPFFLLLSGNVDINKLNRINNLLPFSIQKIENNYIPVQPDIQSIETSNPLIQNNSLNDWNNLPPISQPLATLTVKPESKLISKVRINNQLRDNPLIVSRNFGTKRSVAIIGKDIWKWKLQTASKNLSLFDNFIFSSSRWLNAPDDQKKVRIKSSKKIYSSGETVELSAQIYDESFNPVNNAEVKVKIEGNDSKAELILNPIGGGLYEGKLSIQKNGDYSFTGDAVSNHKLLGNDAGSFNIGDIDLELIDTRMNYEFLNLLANQTNGEFFRPDQINTLIARLNEIQNNSKNEKLITTEIHLWSEEWLLIFLIFLFAAEWFLRKQAGML